MKRRILVSTGCLLLLCGIATAQFGNVVYDPFNEVHFIAQIGHLIATYDQLVLTYKQIQYNATALKNKQRWNPLMQLWTLTRSTSTYGPPAPWVSAINQGIGVAGAYGGLMNPVGLYNFSSMPFAFQQRAKQHYSMLELQDGSNQMAMQTIGTYRALDPIRAAAINNLGETIASTDPANNSEVATLGTISAATYLGLQTAHSNASVNAAILEQLTQKQMQERFAVGYSINADIAFRANAPQEYATHNSQTTTALQSLRIP
jgi:hypothetical protein